MYILKETKRPDSGYIIWNDKLLRDNIDKKEIEKKLYILFFIY